MHRLWSFCAHEFCISRTAPFPSSSLLSERRREKECSAVLTFMLALRSTRFVRFSHGRKEEEDRRGVGFLMIDLISVQKRVER